MKNENTDTVTDKTEMYDGIGCILYAVGIAIVLVALKYFMWVIIENIAMQQKEILLNKKA